MKRNYVHTCWLMIGFLLCSACKNKEDSIPFGDLLVDVNGDVLTLSEVETQMPALLTGQDTTRFLDAYVQDWVQQKLLLQQAERNVSERGRIEEQVAAYRQSLLLNAYKQQLVSERLRPQIGEFEKEQYYKEHLSEFKLNGSLLRGIFLKVPQEAPQIEQVKRWMSNPTAANIEKIEKYSLRNSVVYDYFPEEWVPFAEVMDNIPYVVTNESNFAKSGKLFELKENGYWYLLHISDFLPKGATQPYDFARVGIEEILLNQKRVTFIRSLEKELYQRALQKDEIRFYQWRDTTQTEVQ